MIAFIQNLVLWISNNKILMNNRQIVMSYVFYILLTKSTENRVACLLFSILCSRKIKMCMVESWYLQI